MTRRRSAPAYIADPLPLECAICRHGWPEQCSCQHPTSCRSCSQAIANPAGAGGYCSIDCLLAAASHR